MTSTVASNKFPSDVNGKTTIYTHSIDEIENPKVKEFIEEALDLNKPSFIHLEIHDMSAIHNMRLFLHYSVEKNAMGQPADNVQEEYLWYPFRRGEDPNTIVREGFNTAHITAIPKSNRYLGRGIHLYRNIYKHMAVGDKNPTYGYLLCRCLVGNSKTAEEEYDGIHLPDGYDSLEDEDKQIVVIYNHLRIYPEFSVSIQCSKIPGITASRLRTVHKTLDEGKLNPLRQSCIFQYATGRSMPSNRPSTAPPRTDRIQRLPHSLFFEQKKRVLTPEAIRLQNRKYFPPTLTPHLREQILKAREFNSESMEMPACWKLAYRDPQKQRTVKFLSRQLALYPSDCIYSYGLSPNTLSIYIDPTLTVEIEDIGFRMIKTRKCRGLEMFPDGYREDFPPFPTAEHLDHIWEDIQLYRNSTELERYYPRNDRSYMFRLTRFETGKMDMGMDSLGDYLPDNQKKYWLPIKRGLTMTHCLEIEDLQYKNRKKSWPPKLTNVDFKQLQHQYNKLCSMIPQGKSFFDGSFSKQFTLPDLARIIEGYTNEDEKFEFVHLKTTSLPEWTDCRLGAIDTKSGSFVIPINSEVGVRIRKLIPEEKRQSSQGIELDKWYPSGYGFRQPPKEKTLYVKYDPQKSAGWTPAGQPSAAGGWSGWHAIREGSAEEDQTGLIILDDSDAEKD